MGRFVIESCRKTSPCQETEPTPRRGGSCGAVPRELECAFPDIGFRTQFLLRQSEQKTARASSSRVTSKFAAALRLESAAAERSPRFFRRSFESELAAFFRRVTVLVLEVSRTCFAEFSRYLEFVWEQPSSPEFAKARPDFANGQLHWIWRCPRCGRCCCEWQAVDAPFEPKVVPASRGATDCQPGPSETSPAQVSQRSPFRRTT